MLDVSGFGICKIFAVNSCQTAASVEKPQGGMGMISVHTTTFGTDVPTAGEDSCPQQVMQLVLSATAD